MSEVIASAWTILSELIAVVWTIMVPPLLLIGLLVFLVVRSAVWISRQEIPRWVAWSVSLGVGIALFLVLSAYWRFVSALAARVVDVVQDNGAMQYLTMLPLVIMIALAVWVMRASTNKGVLAACLCLVVTCSGLTFVSARYFSEMLRFEWTISSALNGEIDPDAVGRIQWEARLDREDQAWLRDIPPASDVRCHSSQIPYGACCFVTYLDGRRSEIHIFRSGGHRYAVRKLTDPSYPICRNPDFDPRAVPGSPDSRRYVRCDQRSTS